MKKHIWIVEVPLAIINLAAVIFGRPVPGASNYGVAVFLALDLFGNAFAGGNPEVTISARVGYKCSQEEKMTSFIWELCEEIIDYTFYPMDGENHCWNAYLWTKATLKTKNNHDIHINSGPIYMLCILMVIVIVSCIILILPIKFISLFTSKKGK